MFEEITLADRAKIEAFFRCRRYEGSECTFTNLFMWRDCYKIRRAFDEHALYVMAEREGEPFFLAPFVDETSYLPVAVKKLIEVAEFVGAKNQFRGVYAEIKQEIEAAFPGKFTFTADRENFDYMYLTENMINLSGRKLHGKKNHLNAFKREFPNHQYYPLTQEWVEPCLAFAAKWCEGRPDKNDPSLQCEQCAIKHVLTNLDKLPIKGGVLVVNGQVEAFSFGEFINEDTVLIHVEKANPEIRGLYAAINQQCCEHAWPDSKFVNREEDMGLEGLRRAKESYQPAYLLEKFVAAW